MTDDPTATVHLTEMEIVTIRMALAVYVGAVSGSAGIGKTLNAKTMQGMADLIANEAVGAGQ